MHRAPISKQRNNDLQRILIEAAKVAPMWNRQLNLVHERERARGNSNRAPLVVARKLAAHLLAVDRSGAPFRLRPAAESADQNQEEAASAAAA